MQIRTALIGLGRIAWKLEKDKLRYHPCTHTGSILSVNRLSAKTEHPSPEFVLRGVCDIKQSRIDDFLDWWPSRVAHTSTDYRELLHEGDFDLVIIASNVDSHKEIMECAIQNSTLAIMVEKPVCESFQETEYLRSLAAKNQVLVWVNYERRYHPAYRYVFDFINEKKAGSIRSIHGSVLTGTGFDSRAELGPLLHDAVHWIDLLLWYVGKPSSVSGSISMNEKSSRYSEDYSSLLFQYKDFTAFLQTDGRRRYYEFRMQIDFENGRIVAGNDGHQVWIAEKSKKYEGFRELSPQTIPAFTGNPWVLTYTEIRDTIGARMNGVSFEKLSMTISSGMSSALSGIELVEKARSLPQL